MNTYDVIVIGGGTAGICAAVSAGRNGAKALLIERYGVVGGVATVGLTYHWDPIHIVGVRGMAQEYYDAMKASGNFLDFRFDKITPLTNFWECGASFDPEEFVDYSLKILKEANVDLMLHTMVTGVKVDNGRIQKLTVFNTDAAEVSAPVYIDATGDAVVTYLSGAPYLKAKPDELQAATLMFKIGGVDNEKLFRYLEENPDDLGVHPRLGKMIRSPRKTLTVAGFQSLINKARANGDLNVVVPEHGIGFDRLWRDGEYRVNCTHTVSLDCSDAASLTKAQLSEMEKPKALVRFFNKYIPGCENAYLMQRAVQVGVRETRRIVGDYYLTEQDLDKATRFDDAVVEAEWAHCDVHSPDGRSWQFKMYPGPYQIPYRCFLPQGVENLYAVGRCISCDRPTFGSVRVQLLTMTMGQAIGTAAALISRQETPNTRRLDVSQLQNKLRETGYRI